LGQEKDVLSTIMTHKVITIDADAKVEEALRLMITFDVGSVIITRESTPIGVITERDVTRFAIRGDRLLSLPVTNLMSTPIQTAPPETEIWRAFENMIRLGVRRLPIMQDGKLIGIVTEKDLTRWVLRVFYEPNLPEEIRPLVQQPKSPS
jgi:CBS domain-containing protein